MARRKKTPPGVVHMYGEPDRFLPLLDAEPEVASAAITVKTKVWRWKPDANWYFATIPKPQSALIRSKRVGVKQGWGSVPVTVKIGETEWQTSLFPQGKTGTYLLAIKASVRKEEEIEEGSVITAAVTVSVR